MNWLGGENLSLTGYAEWGVCFWLLLVNLIGEILMAADKGRAKRGAWRIPERTFFVIALLGGSIGCWGGMYLFRHKTRHWYFVLGMPAILAGQLLLVWWLKTHIL